MGWAGDGEVMLALKLTAMLLIYFAAGAMTFVLCAVVAIYLTPLLLIIAIPAGLWFVILVLIKLMDWMN